MTEDAPRWRSKLWSGAAVLLLCLSLATLFGPVLSGDLREVVPIVARSQGDALPAPWRVLAEADQQFVTWGVSRNSYTLIEHPTKLFDTEQCYPAPNALALGEPMITLGLLGVPAYLVSRDPVVTYNLVLIAVVAISALAMYWLVSEWSGSQPAGVVAGLIYAFHPMKVVDVSHPYIDDTVWTVLALIFARRLFARGRWRDALLTASFLSLQLAGSLYPFLAAGLLAIPVFIWLARHYGLGKLRLLPCAVGVAIVLATGLAVYLPYLELNASSVVEARAAICQPWAFFLPGRESFPGWFVLALVLAALGLGKARAVAGIDADPRPALVIGCLLIALMAVSATGLEPPPLYWAISSFLPGLDAVRRPGEQVGGIHLCLSVLAGLGSAAVLRLARPRLAPYLAVALVGVAFLTTLRPAGLGLAGVRYEPLAVKPTQASLDFFRKLAELGNEGPLFETPSYRLDFQRRTSRILATAYHRRPTSTCYNSFHPPQQAEFAVLGRQLPDNAAIEKLHDLGFTTIVVHHPLDEPIANVYRRAEWTRAVRRDRLVRELHRTERMTAYEIRVGR